MVAWPSGLRRWFKAPVFSEAWVRIPPLPFTFLLNNNNLTFFNNNNSNVTPTLHEELHFSRFSP